MPPIIFVFFKSSSLIGAQYSMAAAFYCSAIPLWWVSRLYQSLRHQHLWHILFGTGISSILVRHYFYAIVNFLPFFVIGNFPSFSIFSLSPVMDSRCFPLTSHQIIMPLNSGMQMSCWGPQLSLKSDHEHNFLKVFFITTLKAHYSQFGLWFRWQYVQGIWLNKEAWI